MHHYTYPTLESHFAKMKLYAELNVGKTRSKNKLVTSSPLSAWMRGVMKFLKMYVLQLGFLDGYKGFLLCKNSAWGVWYKYHLLCQR